MENWLIKFEDQDGVVAINEKDRLTLKVSRKHLEHYSTYQRTLLIFVYEKNSYSGEIYLEKYTGTNFSIRALESLSMGFFFTYEPLMKGIELLKQTGLKLYKEEDSEQTNTLQNN
jgi:hypothetical protein